MSVHEDDIDIGDELEASEPSLAERVAAANEATTRALTARYEAYQRFWKGNPTGEDVRIVMDDMRYFCFGDTSTFQENERLHVLLTGRQEYYIRVMDHTRLSLDAFIEKYSSAQEVK